jgi:cytochrome c oxidase subunit 2
MIGAGAVPNTRGHLAGWVIDSQSIKPGNKMPPVYMNADDLAAMLAYLESLD